MDRLNERQMIADPDLGMEISNDTGYDCYLLDAVWSSEILKGKQKSLRHKMTQGKVRDVLIKS